MLGGGDLTMSVLVTHNKVYDALYISASTPCIHALAAVNVHCRASHFAWHQMMACHFKAITQVISKLTYFFHPKQ